MLLQSSPSTEPETERTQSALHALAHQLDERGIDHAFCEGTLPDCTVMHNLDHVMPRMVIWPTTTSEVQFILAAIHGNRGLDRTPKSVVSGGHGYDGEAMCVGIAIDMQRMNACTMETTRCTWSPGAACARSSMYSTVTEGSFPTATP